MSRTDRYAPLVRPLPRLVARPLGWLFTLGLLLGLVGCASVLETLQQVARPSARVTGVRITSLSLDHVQLDFDLEVTNSASVALPLLGLDYSLASGGSPFLSGASEVGGSVPANGTRTIALPLRVGFRETLTALSGVRPGQVFPYRAELGLAVDAPALGRLVLPLSHEGELPIPTVPKVELGSIAWDEISLTRVGGVAKLNVANTNDFAVALQNLSCGLALGGTKVGDLMARPTQELSPGESTTVEIPLGFAPLDLGTGLVNLLRGTGSGYGIDGMLSLDTRFGALELPYSSNGQVPFER